MEIIKKFEGVRQVKKGWMAKCPHHKDRNPSLSISQGRGGVWLMRCFAGCDTADVLRAVGLSSTDLFPKR